MNVVTHPTSLLRLRNDRCPKCNGELDTGFECNVCGFDAIDLAATYDHPAKCLMKIRRYEP